MKLYQPQILMLSVLVCGLPFSGKAQGRKGRPGGPPPADPIQTGVLTNVKGKVSQFNFNREAEVEGFLLNGNTLVHLPPLTAARIESTVHSGDEVEVSGYAQTSPSGLQTIEAQTVQDRSTGKMLSVPQPGAAAPYSGTGRIQQLNYGRDGQVNGLMLDSGVLATFPPFSPANPSSIRVGATISYTGFARSTVGGRTSVDVQSISMNGQQLMLAESRPNDPPRPPARAACAPLPPTASVPPSLPQGRTDQPPPPPPPPPQR